MNGDRIALVALIAVALVCVTVLAGLGVAVPDVLGYALSACVGALTMTAVPRNPRRSQP